MSKYTKIEINGIDRDGRYVYINVDLLEGSITQDGHCKFIYKKIQEGKSDE